MKPIRVLVVDDSAFMRKVISDLVNQAPGMETVGIARDGADALKKIQELKPDVITMDIEMPVLDGISALERIMQVNPVPVIMLSSITREGAEKTLKALELGAVDFVTKPSGQISLDIDKIQNQLIEKIFVAAGAKTNIANPVDSIRPARANITPVQNTNIDPAGKSKLNGLNKLVLIGTSTGGPKALQEVIPKLPASIDAAVMIVQHMPPGFTKSLAERLDSISRVKVKEAEQGEKVVPGCAYIAPGDFHMLFKAQGFGGEKSLNIVLDKSAPRGGHRPSVDSMMESAVEQFWSHMVGVVMTGMGNDGSEGIKLIKGKNGKIIAEDKSSCIVYGMPKAAAETGLVDKVVPLSEIGQWIVRML
ncbi:chemotaxis response regulator protein-glutamate methylesterase cheb [hydrocarbon metagenome]|uniref:protein-glutamate methylesterase n=1 Tax=hydrocarbon metagenome TaxID=938273 RepID=A0A0W8E4R4_9ZZZZ